MPLQLIASSAQMLRLSLDDPALDGRAYADMLLSSVEQMSRMLGGALEEADAPARERPRVKNADLAARVRRDLWAHSPVEIDPDSPRHGTHRDEQKNAFFEFATDRFQEVQRVLHEFKYEGRAEAKDGSYQRYTGDTSVPGKGEILVWQPRT